MRIYMIATAEQAAREDFPFGEFETQRQSLDGSKAIFEKEMEPEDAADAQVAGLIESWYTWPHDDEEAFPCILCHLRDNPVWEAPMEEV